MDRPLCHSRAPPLRLLRGLVLEGRGRDGTGWGRDSRPRPGSAPHGRTQPGSADAVLHVTVDPGEHGGVHRVSAAPVRGSCLAVRRGNLGVPAGQWLTTPVRSAEWPWEACFFAWAATRAPRIGARAVPAAHLPAAHWFSGSAWSGVCTVWPRWRLSSTRVFTATTLRWEGGAASFREEAVFEMGLVSPSQQGISPLLQVPNVTSSEKPSLSTYPTFVALLTT